MLYSCYYRILRVILPLVKSYGVISITTLSPGITLIILTRILPAKMANNSLSAVQLDAKNSIRQIFHDFALKFNDFLFSLYQTSLSPEFC